MGIRRWVVVTAVAVLVVAAVIYGFMPRPVPADVAKTVRGPLSVTVEEEGRTRVIDRFVVSAPVDGFMRRIELEVGDPVQKGRTVVELEPLRSSVLDPRSRAAAEAAVSGAEAALRAAEERARAAAADAAYARSSFERTKKLYEAGYAAEDAFEQARSESQRSEAGLLSAEAAVQVARADLERARTALRYAAAEGKDRIVAVRSPAHGRVLLIHRKSEGVAGSGEPLIDVGDPSRLEVRVEVLSADAVRIKAGTPVLFERWGGDPPLSGRVKVVEPAGFTKISSLGVEEQRVLVIADITSLPESWQRLGDGYRVEARFIVWEGEKVLQVPAGALFRRGEGWAVFTVKNGRAREQRVEVGQRNGLAAEMLSGLVEGEAVVVHPDEGIKEGVRVRPRDRQGNR